MCDVVPRGRPQAVFETRHDAMPSIEGGAKDFRLIGHQVEDGMYL